MRWNAALFSLILVVGPSLADNHSQRWRDLNKDSSYMSDLGAKAKKGNDTAMDELYLRLGEGGWGALSKDTAYMTDLRAKASQGDGAAQEEMVMRTDGQESWQWLQRCAPRWGVCAHRMSEMYQEPDFFGRPRSTFVEPDPVRALEWSKTAAALGNSAGMNSAGMMLERPEDFKSLWPRDLAGAAKYYVQAYEVGDLYGAISMGNLAMNPSFGGPDFAKAELWYKRAGSKGEMFLSFVKSRKAEVIAAAHPKVPASPYPARPMKRQGVVSCATNCNNADCYRTYDDGRQVRFQAQQKWNPLESRFEFDSGGC